MILYRAIFKAEYDDWQSCGRLRSAPGGMEGKHFTESAELARAFGRMFVEAGWDRPPFWVIAVEFDESANVPLYEPKQDGIGPAYFADENALSLVRSVTVRECEETGA